MAAPLHIRDIGQDRKSALEAEADRDHAAWIAAAKPGLADEARMLEKKRSKPFTLQDILTNRPTQGAVGEPHVIVMSQLIALPGSALGPSIGDASGWRDEMVAAVDLLVSGF